MRSGVRCGPRRAWVRSGVLPRCWGVLQRHALGLTGRGVWCRDGRSGGQGLSGKGREAKAVGMGLSDEGGKYGHGFKCANQEPQLVRRCPAPASCPAPPTHYPALLLLAPPPPRCLTCKHTLPNSLLYLLGHKPTTPFHAPPFVSVCPSPTPDPPPDPSPVPGL